MNMPNFLAPVFRRVLRALDAPLVAAPLALVCLGAAGFTLAGLPASKRNAAAANVESARLREENAELSKKIEIAAAAPVDSDAAALATRALFFDGPAESEGALLLVRCAEEANIRRIAYESSATEETGRLEDGASAAILEWPVEVSASGTYTEILELLTRLAKSRPAFGIESLSIKVVRNDDGEVVDELQLSASLATFTVAPLE